LQGASQAVAGTESPSTPPAEAENPEQPFASADPARTAQRSAGTVAPLEALPHPGEVAADALPITDAAPPSSAQHLFPLTSTFSAGHPVPGHAPPTPNQAQAVQQIAAAVTATGEGEAQVALAPEELGCVRMTIRNEDGVTLIRIAAERPETADLMRRHADLLLRDLADNGLASARLSFGGEGGGQSRRDMPRQPGRADPLRPQQGREAAPWPPRTTATGRGLDLRV